MGPEGLLAWPPPQQPCPNVLVVLVQSLSSEGDWPGPQKNVELEKVGLQVVVERSEDLGWTCIVYLVAAPG